MAEATVNESAGAAFRRMMLKAAGIGVVAALVGLGSAGNRAALGAFAGCLAAGVYAVGYVRSHVFRPFSDRTFDSRVARFAVMRIGVVAVAAVAVQMSFGRPALKGYLLAFLVGFAILVITEAPRATKQLRARGIIG